MGLMAVHSHFKNIQKKKKIFVEKLSALNLNMLVSVINGISFRESSINFISECYKVYYIYTKYFLSFAVFGLFEMIKTLSDIIWLNAITFFEGVKYGSLECNQIMALKKWMYEFSCLSFVFK